MVSDLLDSDIGLWEKYTTRERAANGTIRASLRDDVYPEGWTDNIIQANLVGDKPRDLIIAWHNFVTGRINAWKDRQEAEASKRREAHAGGSIRKDASAELDGGGLKAAEGSVSEGEESLESLIESKISTLRRSVSSIEAAIENAVEALAYLREQRSRAISSLRKAEKALKATTK